MTRKLVTARPHVPRRPAKQRRAPLAAFPGAGPLIQRQPTGDTGARPPAHGSKAHLLDKSPGRPLPEATRLRMESSFGADFRAVRLHTDDGAAQLSRALHAQAFTLGTDIFFARAKFAPDSTAGGRLLAHELTHVVQQRRRDVAPGTVQRAHADVKQPPATEPERKPPVDCAAEITPDRTCHDLIAEMIAIQAEQTLNDKYLEQHREQGFPDMDVYLIRARYAAELRQRYDAKERIRKECCPDLEVPPPAPTAAPEPAAPTPSPAPSAP